MDPRFLIPGFSQTPEAWAEVIEGMDRTEALSIPVADSFGATATALAAGRTGVWGGYSLGGRLALQVAVTDPGRVTALLLVSSSPGIVDTAEREARLAADLELAEWTADRTVDEFLDRWFSQPLFVAGRSRRARLATTAAIAHQLRVLGQGIQPPLWDALPNLDMPVAIAAGAEDAKYAGIARAMAEGIGDNARLHLVPGAGHALLEEAPDAIRSILLGL